MSIGEISRLHSRRSKSEIACGCRKTRSREFAKVKSRHDAPQSIFSGRLDIFYPPNFGCLGRKVSFSIPTPDYNNCGDQLQREGKTVPPGRSLLIFSEADASPELNFKSPVKSAGHQIGPSKLLRPRLPWTANHCSASLLSKLAGMEVWD